MKVGATAFTLMPCARPLDGQALRQVRDRRLRHAVDGLGRQRDEAGLRAEVHDAPAAVADHHAAHRLADEERPLQVHGQRAIEVRLGDGLGRVGRTDAGVVDQDVDAAERALRLGDRRLDLARRA